MFGSLFGVVGLGMLLGSWMAFTSTQKFLENSELSEGTVISNELHYSHDEEGNREKYYYPIVEFQTQEGENVKFEADFGSYPPMYQVGEQISIIYNPQNPTDAQINSFWTLWFVSILLLGMGGVFASIGFGILLSLYKAKKKLSNLLANGQKILTQFFGVQLNYSISVNNRHPYQIISQWFDPVNQEVHIFCSENIWFNPEDFIPSQDIPVYVDPQNPKTYYMDISFLPKMVK